MYFSKMHGLSNDFIVIDAIRQNIRLSSKIIRKLADRHLGIGFDQLLIVESPRTPNNDFHYRIFNSNGKEAEQCGNGARCFARFVYSKGLTNKKNIRVSTSNNNLILNIIDNELVQVNMGEPNFEPSEIPFKSNKIKKKYILRIGEQTISCGVVSIGNPHCIIIVQNINTKLIKTIGPIIEKLKCFPKCVNVGFMEIIGPKYIRLRVHERGLGQTLACGSNACAAVAVGIIQGFLAEKVKVELLGGQLNIEWKGYGNPLFMTGPASFVYDGFIYI